MIGASGAISGVLGAYLLLFPRAQVKVLIPFGFILQRMRMPALWVLGLWFGMQLLNSALTSADQGGWRLLLMRVALSREWRLSHSLSIPTCGCVGRQAIADTEGGLPAPNGIGRFNSLHDSEVVKKPTALGMSRSGGARNPHVFQHTLRLLAPSLGLAPSGLALRFAPGETVLRSGETRPHFARDGFFHNLSP